MNECYIHIHVYTYIIYMYMYIHVYMYMQLRHSKQTYVIMIYRKLTNYTLRWDGRIMGKDVGYGVDNFFVGHNNAQHI